MPQVAIAAAAYWAAGAAAEYAAFNLLLGATGSALFGAAVGAAVTVAGSAAVASVTRPDVDAQERKQTVRQAAASRRIIYGEVKAGGVLVYASTSGLNNEYANLVIAVCEGEIDGFDPVIWLNDERSDDPKFVGLVDVHFYTGRADQVASAELIAESPDDWTADHRLCGVAYVYVRLKFDQNAFPGGLPQPAFLPRGRLTFDPRFGLRRYTQNPALAVLDYLRTDERAGQYFSLGMDCPDNLIDFASFAAAANVCDELVASADPLNLVDGVPNLVKRYTLNGMVDLGGSPASIVEQLQGACAGRLVFSQGKYRFYAGAFTQPVGTIVGEMLRADASYRPKQSRRDLFNLVRGTYVEPRQEWSDTDYAPQVDAAAMLADNGSEIVQELQLPFTTNGATAQRIAALALAQNRNSTGLNLQCNWSALRFRLWDVVTINIPEINLVGVTFRIVQYSFAEGGGIDLVLQMELSSSYVWSADREVVVKDVRRPVFNDGSPDPVEDLVVSGAPRIEQYGTIPLITATWADTQDAFFQNYEVATKLSSDAEYFETATTTAPSFTRQLVDFGAEYDLRVRVVNLDGRTSDWVEVTGTLVENDTSAPGVPTDLSVTGAAVHTIHWTTPAADDFKKSNVYVNTTMTSVGAVMVASVIGLQSTAYTANNTPGSLPAYYYVSSVDRTGNESALTYAGTGL